MAEIYLTIVVPAYNEASRIGKGLVEIRHYIESRNFPVELIVVDDGSTDQTVKIVSQFPEVRLLSNGRNRGKGFSVRHGALEARGQYTLFTDADLSAPIDDAGELLKVLESSGADAAIGSRALRRELIGIHQPWRRELAGRVFNLLVRLFTGLRLRDTQCGFKLFRRETTRRAFELQRVDGFGFDPELLFLVERLGGKVVEVPVRWNDNPGTKVRFLRDSVGMFWDLVALRWRALRGKYRP